MSKIPDKLTKYILGKDSMPQAGDFTKKEKSLLNKLVIDLLGSKYITLYRGFSLGCEVHEIGEIFLDENALVSFTEDILVAQEIARERSLDRDLGVVIEISIPTSAVLFHYGISEIGNVFSKEKEVIAQPYSFEWRAVNFFKNGKIYKE